MVSSIRWLSVLLLASVRQGHSKIADSTASSQNTVYFTFPESERVYVDDSSSFSEPLLLSEYIKRGEIEEARNLSSVDESLFLNVKSYSGKAIGIQCQISSDLTY